MGSGSKWHETTEEFLNFPSRVILFALAGWIGGVLGGSVTWPFLGYEFSALFGVLATFAFTVAFFVGAIQGDWTIRLAVGTFLLAIASAWLDDQWDSLIVWCLGHFAMAFIVVKLAIEALRRRRKPS